jgi:hypothetical protein
MFPNVFRFAFRFDNTYDSFDCVSWKSSLATRLSIPNAQLRICSLRRGSTEVEVESDSACTGNVDSLMNQIRNGDNVDLGAPILSATDPNGNTVVPPSEPFPYIGLWGLLWEGLIVAALIIVICCVKKHKDGRYRNMSSQPYIQMESRHYTQ